MVLKFLYGLQKYRTKRITIAGRPYTAILADTSLKRAIGLMFRGSLGKDHCMLFRFGHPGFHSIWMKNMNFPIDAIWLDGDGVVVSIREGLKPCRSSIFSCPQYAPTEEASYLIEVNAGDVKRKKIRTGSKARH